MTTQEIPVPSAPARKWNGHWREKNSGDTRYTGPIEPLPYPTGPVNIEDAIESMYEDGYAIIPAVFSREEVAALRARFDAMGGPDSQYDMPGWCFNKHLVFDFPNDPNCLELIDRPGVIDVVDAIHDVPFGRPAGAAPVGGIVTGGTIWITGKGRGMGVHLDTVLAELPESIYNDPAVRIPIYKSTVHYYLDDMRMDLGPTLVIPGSHKAGRYPHNESTWHGIAPQAVMVKAGDAMIFRTEVWHAAAMNTSEQRRYMIQVFYGANFISPGFPPMRYDKYWSPEVIAKSTPRQRRLLGGAKAKTSAY
jgi:hypothetical protein